MSTVLSDKAGIILSQIAYAAGFYPKPNDVAQTSYISGLRGQTLAQIFYNPDKSLKNTELLVNNDSEDRNELIEALTNQSDFYYDVLSEYSLVETTATVEGGYDNYDGIAVSNGSNVTFVSKGTDPSKTKDLLSDAEAALGLIPGYMEEAKHFYNEVVSNSNLSAGELVNVNTAGHSLGGMGAEAIALEALSQDNDVAVHKSVTYEGYGVEQLLALFPANLAPIQDAVNNYSSSEFVESIASIMGSTGGVVASDFESVVDRDVIENIWELAQGKIDVLETIYDYHNQADALGDVSLAYIRSRDVVADNWLSQHVGDVEELKADSSILNFDILHDKLNYNYDSYDSSGNLIHTDTGIGTLNETTVNSHFDKKYIDKLAELTVSIKAIDELKEATDSISDGLIIQELDSISQGISISEDFTADMQDFEKVFGLYAGEDNITSDIQVKLMENFSLDIYSDTKQNLIIEEYFKQDLNDFSDQISEANDGISAVASGETIELLQKHKDKHEIIKNLEEAKLDYANSIDTQITDFETALESYYGEDPDDSAKARLDSLKALLNNPNLKNINNIDSDATATEATIEGLADTHTQPLEDIAQGLSDDIEELNAEIIEISKQLEAQKASEETSGETSDAGLSAQLLKKQSEKVELTAQLNDNTKEFNKRFSAISNILGSEDYERELLDRIQQEYSDAAEIDNADHDALEDIVDDLADQNRSAQQAQIFRGDPLTLDLDGDGIETLSVDEGVLFDHEAKQVKEGTGWIGADDGLLVRDLDNDGDIESGRELFGDNTIKLDGTKATDGFDALSDLDSNSDGIFDINDEAFDEVQLWQDANSDGISQVNELKSLSQAGIESIDLSHEEVNQSVAGGVVSDIGNYKKTDGTVSEIGNLFLDKEPARSEFTDSVTISDEVLNSVVDIKGTGAVRNLSQAASLSPELSTLLAQISDNPTQEIPTGELLKAWTETSDFSDTLGLENLVLDDGTSFNLKLSTSVRSNLEKIQALETFTGNKIIQTNIENDKLTMTYGSISANYSIQRGQENTLSDSVISNAWRRIGRARPINIAQIISSYQTMFDKVDKSLFNQITYPELAKNIIFETNAETGELEANFEQFNNNLVESLQDEPRVGINLVTKLISEDSILNLGGWDYQELLTDRIPQALSLIVGEASTIVHTEGLSYDINGKSYTLRSDKQRNTSDIILGTKKDDVIHNDNDRGDDDIVYGRQGDDTLIDIAGNNVLDGGAGNDYIKGKGELRGGDGSDTLLSHSYNTSVLEGGKGDDSINAGLNSVNTIRYNLGDGFDIIKHKFSRYEYTFEDRVIFGEGISKEDLTMGREGGDLIVAIKGDATQGMRIEGFYSAVDSSKSKVSSFEFADGTIVDRESNYNFFDTNIFGDYGDDELEGSFLSEGIYGYEGNDTLRGNEGNDTLYGDEGDDTLEGGAGDDYLVESDGTNTLIGGEGDDDIASEGDSVNTIVYNLGDGFDYITSEYWDTEVVEDKIVFGEGIDRDRISFLVEDSSIIINIDNDPDQGMELYSAADPDSNVKIEGFYFVDGTSLSLDEVRSLASNENIQGTLQDDDLDGGFGDDVISGLAGDDLIEDDSGTNTLIGGEGDDIILSGGSGNNIIEYNLGDGFDSINISKGNDQALDKIVLGEGITKGNLSLSLDENNYSVVAIINNDSTQGFRVNGIYRGHKFANLGIEFANGDFMSSDDIYDEVLSENLVGTDQIDHLDGEYGNDTLSGLDGNDILQDQFGDNTFIGGRGNDTIVSGGDGNNIIKYNLGDGFDVIHSNKWDEGLIDEIVFGEGITKDNLSISLDDSDYSVVVNINNDPEQGMKIKGVFRGDRVVNTSFKFADGDLISPSEIFGFLFGKDVVGTDTGDILDGSIGNDTIIAKDGDDILDGKGGNDVLEGGYGNDTYVFNKGSGEDTVIENGIKTYTTGWWFWKKTHRVEENDTIEFGEGLNQEDMSIGYSGDDIHITFSGADGDKLILKDYDQSTISRFEFADGSVLERSGIQASIDNDSELVNTATSENVDNTNQEDDLSSLFLTEDDAPQVLSAEEFQRQLDDALADNPSDEPSTPNDITDERVEILRDVELINNELAALSADDDESDGGGSDNTTHLQTNMDPDPFGPPTLGGK